MEKYTLAENRRKRGEVDDKFVNQFTALPTSDIAALLKNISAQKRSAAAIILSRRTDINYIPNLIEQLKSENALYTKINICNALSGFGEIVVPELLTLLGKVGKNQHYDLPLKGFYKSNYPLPRDIIARTLIRIGEPVLKYIEPFIRENEEDSILEAIDVIGHISFYTNNNSSEDLLIEIFNKSHYNVLLRWKIIRAFQGFNSQRINKILVELISSEAIYQFKWEALRCLLIHDKNFAEEVRDKIEASEDSELKKIFKTFSY